MTWIWDWKPALKLQLMIGQSSQWNQFQPIRCLDIETGFQFYLEDLFPWLFNGPEAPIHHESDWISTFHNESFSFTRCMINLKQNWKMHPPLSKNTSIPTNNIEIVTDAPLQNKMFYRWIFFTINAKMSFITMIYSSFFHSLK